MSEREGEAAGGRAGQRHKWRSYVRRKDGGGGVNETNQSVADASLTSALLNVFPEIHM